jgi:hypothetical protein
LGVESVKLGVEFGHFFFCCGFFSGQGLCGVVYGGYFLRINFNWVFLLVRCWLLVILDFGFGLGVGFRVGNFFF